MTSRDIQLLELKNCQIRFTSPEGDYEGTVFAACPVAKKIIVCKIFYLPKRIPMGTLSFQFREILSYTILSRPDTTSLKNEDSERSTYSYAPPRASDMCLLDDCSEAGGDEIYEDVRLEDLYEEEKFELKIPPQHASRVPIDNVVFDRIDEEFHQAIKHIFQQDCIGVSLEGPKIGRNGILSWFCVSTSSCTFLFDVETLGERAFKEGLKKILENPNIEKVLHDCRQASDCLFHKYNTRLVNVFDTQAADLLVTMQRSRDCKFSKRVSSLDSCLRTYLQVPEDYIHRPKVYRTYEDSVVFSRLRPLQSDKRDLILKNVMYLRSLKRELNFALLTPFHRAVDVYLQVLQTATDQELLLETSVPEEPPPELMMEGIQIVRFKEFMDVPPVVASGPPYRKLRNPVKDYASHCSKIGIGCQSSSSSNMNGSECSANMKLADKSNPLKENTSQSVESNRNSKVLKPDDVASAIKVTSNGKDNTHTTAEDLVQKNCSKLEGNSDSSNIINANDSKTIADYIRSLKNRRYHQLKKAPPPSKFSAQTLAFQKSHSFQDTSNSDLVPFQPYQNVLIDIQNRQKPVLLKEKNLVHSSSDSMDSSDDDPWAAMRAEFATCDYSAEHTKRNIRFYPAG